MGTETTRRILEKIDEILAAIGQRDRETFRDTMRRGSVLLTNLGACCTTIGDMNDNDWQRLVGRLQDSEQEQALKMLTELQSSFLPAAAKALIDYAQTLPQSQGGRPRSFKDRTAMQAACKLVLQFIENGYSEAIAIRSTARKLKVSAQTMRRTWNRRSELLGTQEDITEFISRLLKGFATAPPSGTPETLQVTNKPTAASDTVLQSARAIEQEVTPESTPAPEKQS